MTKTIEMPGVTLPEIDDVTRREFLIGAAGLLLLPAGCGSDGDSGGEASGETRTIDHVYGTTEVPKEAGRVVVVDPSHTPAILVALNLVPVAAASYELGGSRPFEEDLYPDMADAEVLGLGGSDSVNLEAVAAQDPNLITGQASFVDEAQYGRLSEIAPTVVWRYDQTDLADGLKFLGAVLGRKEQAEAHLAEVEQRIAEGQQRVGEIGTVSLVSIYADDSLAFYNEASWPGQIVSRFGGDIEPTLEDIGGEIDGGYRMFASAELLSRASGDHLVLVQLDSADEEAAERTARRQPLFSSLPAAQANRVVVVDRLQALTGSPRGQLEVLDQLIAHFSEHS